MKRHYTNYFKGIPHFKDYRIKMVTSDNPEEVHAILDDVANKFSEVSF
jgi:tRNA-dihydrouridine synthase B